MLVPSSLRLPAPVNQGVRLSSNSRTNYANSIKPLMKYGYLSVVCTLLTVPTFFLMVTVILFPMLGLYFGCLSYSAHLQDNPNASSLKKFRAALPMVFAIATFLLGGALITTTYRA